MGTVRAFALNAKLIVTAGVKFSNAVAVKWFISLPCGFVMVPFMWHGYFSLLPCTISFRVRIATPYALGSTLKFLDKYSP